MSTLAVIVAPKVVAVKFSTLGLQGKRLLVIFSFKMKMKGQIAVRVRKSFPRFLFFFLNCILIIWWI